MLSHTGTLWQYLGSFVLYTLGAVALIYGAYWYARRSTTGFLPGAAATVPEEAEVPLVLEASLSLEPQKNLYIIRSGKERFLIAASGEATQLLSKLESVETEAEAPVEIPIVEETPKLEPWYTPGPQPVAPPAIRRESFGSRFVKSVQWLVSSRMK